MMAKKKGEDEKMKKLEAEQREELKKLDEKMQE